MRTLWQHAHMCIIGRCRVRKIFKLIGWLLLTLIGIAVLVYLAVLFINRNDRPVAPAAVRLGQLAASLPAVPDNDNGYVFVMGFGAGKNEDPVVNGAKQIAWMRQMAAQEGTGANWHAPFKEQAPNQAFDAATTKLGERCKKVDRACLAALEAGGDAIASWLSTELWVLQRYQALITRPAWRNTAPLDSRLPFPRFAPLLYAQRLQFLQAWTAAGHGDAQAVTRLLDNDAVFWRTVLASSDSLIIKIIAVAAVKRNFEWGNLILRRLPPSVAGGAVPDTWQRALSTAERSLLLASSGEFAYIASTVKMRGRGKFTQFDESLAHSTIGKLADAVLAPTFQPQDFLNRHAAMLAAVSDTLDVPLMDYPEALARARKVAAQHADAAFDDPLYNGFGDLLLNVGAPDFTAYSAKINDLEGVRRLALLASELRASHTAPAAMAHALARATLRIPYNDKPFGWNTKAAALVFNGLAPGTHGSVLLLY